MELFDETIRIIRNECDVIINVTTGVGPNAPLSERIAIILRLSADRNVPEHRLVEVEIANRDARL